ncbi:hypothetical protein EV356DRAFT_525389 [Viridothelium virens]|uniref:CID domain-containing protein n=1 Tax=Viridothelium virens TaxID=1048519 RepID=A0A6A6H2G2_VIRVR|nr:hypothetical protein EV356DRAFT_525389 [Viridothelium virens]
MASSSDEVAADFEDSLKDLQINNRYEISNLTIIAKENTEHAQAISEVLEKHIRKTPPQRKLPALYVLDSIVKNVGSPYPVYLGKNLFSTFMDAYQLVDPATRRNMEGMLKTWKEGIPNSGDPSPVFQSEVTKRIENALIKAKTAAVQSQQNQARSNRSPFPLPPRPMQSPALPYRNTPTPPHQNSMYSAPPPNVGQVPYGNAAQPRQFTNPQTLAAQPSQQYPTQFTPSHQYNQYASPSNPQADLERLLHDIDRLIKTAQSEWAANFGDTGVQKRLQALLDLQNIVRGQQLPPEQLKAVQDQVSSLSAQAHHVPKPLQQFQPTQNQPNTARTYSPQPLQQASQQFQPSSSQPPPTQGGIDMNMIARILGTSTPIQQPTHSIPQIHSVAPSAISTPQNQIQPNAPPATTPQSGTGTSLLDALRSAGFVGGTPATPASAAPPTLPLPAASIVQQLSTPPSLPTGLPKPVNTSKNDVNLNPASLKTPRPDLYISRLLSSRPNQCSTCGRRFTANDTGRAQKQRHLDWHFRTNRRMQDESRRGQNRAFYIDELAWIKSREIDESADPNAGDNGSGQLANGAVAADGGTGTAGKEGTKDPKMRYIPVPPDAAATKPRCPICQEEWKSVWRDEVQDWVWMDAIKVGGRVYHATCYEEVNRGLGVGTQAPKRETPTPDSILGKRKGEIEGRDVRMKLKKEGL